MLGHVILAGIGITLTTVPLVAPAVAGRPAPPATNTMCEFMLSPAPGQPGTAQVTIDRQRKVVVKFTGARPNTLYTVWTDHRSRATGELSNDYPLAKLAEPRGVAPTFATTAGVTAGLGLDPNAIITDAKGNARLEIVLNFDILAKGSSPVVANGFATRGENIYGGGWLRYHKKDATLGPSLQVVDSDSGLPRVIRATAQGLTIVGHPDRVSHGHSPGVGGIDHFPAFDDDFPQHCRD